MEKIISIEDATFKNGSDWYSYDGFVITTDKQQIKLGIYNGQSCCENWGYFMTNDDVSEFVGASIHEVKLVDTCLNVDKAPDIYEGAVMYVNIETNRGTLQFTAYNEHNGYYGHDAVVICEQLNHEEYL